MKLLAAALLAALLIAQPATTSAASTAASTATSTATPRWLWPLAGAHVVTRPYLAPATPYGAGHRGVDLEATSTLVFAPADGVVHFAGVVVDRPVLSLLHSGGVLSSFEPVETSLVAGDLVTRGDVIGTLLTGHCRVVLCLHLGVRLGGEYVSPLLFLGGVPRAVLLPTRAEADAHRARGSPRGRANRRRSSTVFGCVPSRARTRE